MKMIQIKQSTIDHIILHAQKVFPIEACGYLAGLDHTITQSYVLRNTDNSVEHFSFDPAEQFAVVREARNTGLEILANFHSHPYTPARPSKEDIRMANDPGILYFIISLAEKAPQIKAFKIQHSIVEEVIIELLN
jgi:proteasome lid subunit RPN8/RPN11